MIKKIFLYSLSFGIIFISSCTAQNFPKGLGDILNTGTLSTDQVASGLKQALEKGTNSGSETASKVDGYFKNPKIKIPFPSDIQRVENTLRQMGLGKQVDNFVLSLNRAAEKAAVEAKPIFVSAIRSMTIQDAWAILKGEKDAATRYLDRTTSPQLKAKFQPVIKDALNQVNATKYYSDLINTYNKIPLVQKVNPNLDEYATDKAIYGLFVLIAEEEANIRENPAARTTELLRKVFGQAK